MSPVRALFFENLIQKIKECDEKYHGLRELGTPEKIQAFRELQCSYSVALDFAKSKEELETINTLVLLGTKAKKVISERLLALSENEKEKKELL